MSGETSFGQWLRQRRRRLDLTQQALADQVGCARITLRRIEANALKPSKELAQILLERLGIPERERPNWLLFARGLGELPEKSALHSQNQESLTNLPIPLTSFIGRESDVARIKQRLSEHRLVTLTGGGGIGKTRLSQQVAGQLLENYEKGIWLVELASLNDSGLVPQTVAEVLGIQNKSDRLPIEILIHVLRAKSILLILDNCEHLLDTCAQLADKLLKSCVGLKILATSREALGIVGEALYPVPALKVPDFEKIESVDKSDYEAIRLFAERAGLAQMDFAITPENMPSIAQICARLDGIPLAIELAAARVQTFSPDEIASQLEDRFQLLTTRSSRELPKHQSLRASMDWSWELLSESEQTFMRQLSVFAGGWTLEAAQAVCDGNVLELSNALVKKSLLMVNHESRYGTRYRFHEVVRQYAREKLEESGEGTDRRNRHLNYFLRFSEQAETALRGPAQTEWMSRLNEERDNIRAALEWAKMNDVESGLYLSGRLRCFWENFDVREGARWLAEFLQNSDSKDYPLARAKALCTQARLAFWSQDFDLAYAAAQESLDLSRTYGDKIGEIDALFALGLADFKAPNEKIVDLYKQALVLSQSIRDSWRQAYALAHLGGYNNIPSQLEEAATLFEKFGDLETSSNVMLHLVRTNLLDGNLQSAQKWLEKVAKVSHSLNNKMLEAEILHNYGRIALLERDYKKARDDLQDALEIANAVRHQMTSLWTHVHLGYVAVQEGNLKEAHDIFTKTAQEFQRDGSESGVVFTLEGMAGLAVSLGKHGRAAWLIGWADSTRQKTNDPRPFIEQAEVDQIITACLMTLGKEAFSYAYDEGQKMTLDEAVAYALNEA